MTVGLGRGKLSEEWNDRGDLGERRSHGKSVCLSVAMIMVNVIMIIRRV
jgi:hypothetical protein